MMDEVNEFDETYQQLSSCTICYRQLSFDTVSHIVISEESQVTTYCQSLSKSLQLPSEFHEFRCPLPSSLFLCSDCHSTVEELVTLQTEIELLSRMLKEKVITVQKSILESSGVRAESGDEWTINFRKNVVNSFNPVVSLSRTNLPSTQKRRRPASKSLKSLPIDNIIKTEIIPQDFIVCKIDDDQNYGNFNTSYNESDDFIGNSEDISEPIELKSEITRKTRVKSKRKKCVKGKSSSEVRNVVKFPLLEIDKDGRMSFKGIDIIQEINDDNNPTFKCSQCELSVTNSVKIRNHIKSQHRGLWNCDDCTKKFSAFTDLQRHVKNKCKPRKQNCTICGKLEHKSTIREHEWTHKNEVEKFQVIAQLKRRGEKLTKYQLGIKNESRGSYMYTCCDKVFLNSSQLAVHKTRDNEPSVHLCPDCGKTFSSEQSLRYHRLKTHERPSILQFKCPHENCERQFVLKTDLASHIKTAHDKTRTPCSKCGKLVRRLGLHMRTHSEERKYICSYEGCEKSYKTTVSLHNHIKYIHLGRPYPMHTRTKRNQMLKAKMKVEESSS